MHSRPPIRAGHSVRPFSDSNRIVSGSEFLSWQRRAAAWVAAILSFAFASGYTTQLTAADLPGLAAAAGQVRPGGWFEIPNSSIKSVLIAQDDRRIKGRPAMILNGWNGAAFDGRRLYFHGGGHRAYSGNEVYSFDLATLSWSRLTEPNFNPDGESKGECPYPEPLDGEGNPTVPRTVHTYDGLIWTPLTNTIFRFAGVDWCARGMAYGGDNWEFDPATRRWTQHADTPAAERGFAVSTALDSGTGRIVILGKHFAYEYDPLTDQYLRRSSLLQGYRFGNMEIDPLRRVAVIVDRNGLRTLPLDGTTLGVPQSVSLHGDIPDVDAKGRWSVSIGAAGLAYSAKTGLWVLWDGGSGETDDARRIYTVDLDTGEMVLYPNAQGAGPRPPRKNNGVYSKFVYVAAYDVFVAYNNIDQGVWLYRLPEKSKAEAPLLGPARGTLPATPSTAAGAEMRVAAISALSTVADSGVITGSSTALRQVERLDVIRICPRQNFTLECDYDDIADALKHAQPGQVVVIARGEYRQSARIDVARVMIVGELGAHFIGAAHQGKALFVVAAEGVTIAGIECSGVQVPDGNGACIRLQASSLTVRESYFHDNEMHILGGTPGGTILIENNRFNRTISGPKNHSVYLAKGTGELIFRGNIILRTGGAGLSGHDIKCGAARCIIENNVIAGLDGRNSRAMDFMCGGDIVIRQNIVEKGPLSDNPDMVGLANEFSKGQCTATAHKALIEGNQFIFDLTGELAHAGRLIARSNLPGPITLKDNVFVGMAKGVGRDAKGRNLKWIDGGGNVFHESRSTAGLPPYPELQSLN